MTERKRHDTLNSATRPHACSTLVAYLIHPTSLHWYLVIQVQIISISHVWFETSRTERRLLHKPARFLNSDELKLCVCAK
jgi:hypothetical protein